MDFKDDLTTSASNLATLVGTISEPLSDDLTAILAEVMLLTKRVSEENAVLEDQVRENKRAKEDVESDLQLCMNKLSAQQEDLNAALTATAALEVELEARKDEIEGLRRENKQLARDAFEYESRLATELASWEKIKADWAGREAQFQEAIKSQLRSNKELKTETLLKDKQLEDLIAGHESAVVATLQDAIADKDSQIAKLETAASSSQSLSAETAGRLQSVEAQLTALKAENFELQNQNRFLMEEQESYLILLRERTLTGEFMNNSAVMQPAARSSLSDELTPNAAKFLPAKPVSETDQVAALTLYISKILNKILADEDLEAKLVEQPVTPKTPAPVVSWPFREVGISARAASPNRHRSGLRGVSPAPRSQSPLRAPGPRTAGKPRKGPLLSVSTDGGPSDGPASAPMPRPRGGDAAIAKTAEPAPAEGAETTDTGRLSVDEGGRSSDEYVAPPRLAPPEAGSDFYNGFNGFVRRISNAFASLTSPLPVEDGHRKELVVPTVPEGEAEVETKEVETKQEEAVTATGVVAA
ncbi:hypothetical protein HK101_008403 [Irineochytrium annulatum]|nr:hypothetical protein HK101_008403 [Irineochytrium annulatum]